MKSGGPALLAAAGVGLCLSFCAPARAQATSIVPIRLKLGAMLPSDGDVRDWVGSPLLAAEVDVDLPAVTAGTTRFSLGYIDRRKSGRGFRTVPLTVSRIFTPPNPASALVGTPYFGAGVGVYYIDKSGPNSDKQTTLGVFAVAGYQFPRPLAIINFVEAKYHLVSGGANGLSPNGLVLFLGRRL